MKQFKSFLSIVFLAAFLAASFSSCSSKSYAYNGSKGSKTSYSKKNKSYYRQRFSSKQRSTRKDYVIKNGIAN